MSTDDTVASAPGVPQPTVTSAAAPSSPAAASSLHETLSKRATYAVEGTHARGGMGAILSAKDLNIRRTVAMKVMLRDREVSQEQVYRFVEEAQVTGQMEHPNIVPVHELGLDDEGQPFYTMKFVQGVTLKDVLAELKAGKAETASRYTLAHLLTIFQKVCDAVAFAHSRGVVHRDLKPENMMIGEYGEVLVMDWGLAKVLGRQEEVTDQSPVTNHPSLTMDGTIMGTPSFMAPEQAEGRIGDIDPRTDIYALGGVLYNILTLHTPVTGNDVQEMLQRILAGEILPPSSYNTKTKTRQSGAVKVGTKTFPQPPLIPLRHCPGHRIPDSLGAVVMKALALKREDRYQSVPELQKEIAAYQGGFATAAEKASTWKLLHLFIKRNKAASIATAVVLVLVVFSSIHNYQARMVAVRERNRAASERDRAEKAFASYKEEQTRRLTERKGSAPAFLDAARTALDAHNFAAALAQVGVAVESDPALGAAQLLRAQLLIHAGQYSEAIPSLEAYLQSASEDKESRSLLELCRQAQAQPRRSDISAAISGVLMRQGVPILGMAVAGSLEEKAALYRAQLAKAWPAFQTNGVPRDSSRLKMNPDGTCDLNLNGLRSVTDLSPLRGLSLVRLSLGGLSNVTDLAPLQGMALRELDIEGVPLANFSILTNLPLSSLRLTLVDDGSDLSFLRQLPLKSLSVQRGALARIAPALAELKLTSLALANVRADNLEWVRKIPLRYLSLIGPNGELAKLADLSPLREVPLEELRIIGPTAVTNFAPLADCSIKRLRLAGVHEPLDLASLTGSRIEELTLIANSLTNLEAVLSMPALRQLRFDGCKQLTALPPLTGRELKILSFSGCPLITDVSCLQEVRVATLGFSPQYIRTGWNVLRAHPTIRQFLLDGNGRLTSSAEFWKRYDAGEFRDTNTTAMAEEP